MLEFKKELNQILLPWGSRGLALGENKNLHDQCEHRARSNLNVRAFLSNKANRAHKPTWKYVSKMFSPREQLHNNNYGHRDGVDWKTDLAITFNHGRLPDKIFIRCWLKLET